MKAARVAAVAALVVAAGAIGWWFLRGEPCKKLEDRLCAFVAGECAPIQKLFELGKPPPEACRRASEALDGVATAPLDVQAASMKKVISELFGVGERE